MNRKAAGIIPVEPLILPKKTTGLEASVCCMQITEKKRTGDLYEHLSLSNSPPPNHHPHIPPPHTHPGSASACTKGRLCADCLVILFGAATGEKIERTGKYAETATTHSFFFFFFLGGGGGVIEISDIFSNSTLTIQASDFRVKREKWLAVSWSKRFSFEIGSKNSDSYSLKFFFKTHKNREILSMVEVFLVLVIFLT